MSFLKIWLIFSFVSIFFFFRSSFFFVSCVLQLKAKELSCKNKNKKENEYTNFALLHKSHTNKHVTIQQKHTFQAFEKNQKTQKKGTQMKKNTKNKNGKSNKTQKNEFRFSNLKFEDIITTHYVKPDGFNSENEDFFVKTENDIKKEKSIKKERKKSQSPNKKNKIKDEKEMIIKDEEEKKIKENSENITDDDMLNINENNNNSKHNKKDRKHKNGDKKRNDDSSVNSSQKYGELYEKFSLKNVDFMSKLKKIKIYQSADPDFSINRIPPAFRVLFKTKQTKNNSNIKKKKKE